MSVTFETHEELVAAIEGITLTIDGDLTVNFDICIEASIDARNIRAGNIRAGNIRAWNIDARNIRAGNIRAGNIDARNISYYACCFAYESFKCKALTGRRETSKHFCLDSDIVFEEEVETSCGAIINLDDYETEPIDYTGCHPVVRESLKYGLSIECEVWGAVRGENQKAFITAYSLCDESDYPYRSGGDFHRNAEPIKKKKTETRVKGAVEVMAWLVRNGFEFFSGPGNWETDVYRFDKHLWRYCGKPSPVSWEFPELLEEVEA